MKTQIIAICLAAALEAAAILGTMAADSPTSDAPAFGVPSTPSLVTAASILAVLRGGGPKSDGPNFQDIARGANALLGDRAAQTDALANPNLSQPSGSK